MRLQSHGLPCALDRGITIHKEEYVSHTVADYTAILALIEKRFTVAPLTQRDAAQMDMTEFFDFQNVLWATPPDPPTQATGGVCDFQNLGYPGP